jgi:hypothetical protein
MNAPIKAGVGTAVDEMLRSLETYRVAVQSPEEVRAYLAKYSDLIPHVGPTVESVRQGCGDGAGLSLTINDDPEFYDPYLKLYVRLPRYDEEADRRLGAISAALSEAIAEQEGYFRVAADYRNPAG